MVDTFSILSSEKNITQNLLNLLEHFESFRCVSICSDPIEAMDSVLKNLPAIVFIDIDKKGRVGDPFQFVNELHQYMDVLPSFVAISISKSKAYEVIKNNFFDYLLKPISEYELRKLLMKFQKQKSTSELEKICLRSYSDYQFLDLSEILFLKADNNTTDFFLIDGRKISAFKTLKHFEGNLSKNFLRVHHSYIVNVDHINRINFAKSSIFLKGNFSSVPFSKSYKKQVDQIKEGIYTSLSIVI